MSLFAELSLLVGVATLAALAMRLLRQPLLIGYILAGLIVGPLLFGRLGSPETLVLFGEIGIAFLLFVVGLNLNPHMLREIGGVALATGILQMVITTTVGAGVGIALGFSTISALYLGVALSFSSTIIILKLLSDKRDLGKLYARISIGFLLVQDLAAILLLLALPIAAYHGSSLVLGAAVIKAVLLALVVFGVARGILVRLNNFLASSQELLFLVAIAWGMGVAALFRVVGFSLESGALVAGVALSLLPARHEIAARLSPLRDFFLVIFFILLGGQMAVGDIRVLVVPAMVFSLLVLVGNPLILMAIMGFLGYRKKTGLQVGLTVAQVSEFSLILIALGISLGHLDPAVLSLTTLVGLITIFGSTYLILNSDRLYNQLAPHLGIFERALPKREAGGGPTVEAILFGYNRIGYDFLHAFRKLGLQFLVVDYNPGVIARLEHSRLPARYGDASDLDFLEGLPLARAGLVVSTIPEVETNILVVRESKRQNPQGIALVVAHQIEDALTLYRAGADFVVLPHFLGGAYAAHMVERLGLERGQYHALRREHLERLQERARIGHEHPRPEKFR